MDPTEQLDEDVSRGEDILSHYDHFLPLFQVEDVLLTIADDFIEQTVSQACALARHRKANTIDVRDVQMVLEKNWNM